MNRDANELVLPRDALYERLGLKPSTLVPASRAVNIRKIRHVTDDGHETVYLNATDLLALLDREFELSDSQHVSGIARVIRQIVGQR